MKTQTIKQVTNDYIVDPHKGVRYTGFYSTKQWKQMRDEIKLRDKMTCAMCHRAITGRYIVDHIKELTYDNMYDYDVAYNPENLQLLCIECHNYKTFSKRENAKSRW